MESFMQLLESYSERALAPLPAQDDSPAHGQDALGCGGQCSSCQWPCGNKMTPKQKPT